MAVFKRLRREVADIRRMVGTDRRIKQRPYDTELGYGAPTGGGTQEGILRSGYRAEQDGVKLRADFSIQIRELQNQYRRDLRQLEAFIPDLWAITKFKSTERPPEELFKVVNKLSKAFAYGPTEEEAKAKVLG